MVFCLSTVYLTPHYPLQLSLTVQQFIARRINEEIVSKHKTEKVKQNEKLMLLAATDITTSNFSIAPPVTFKKTHTISYTVNIPLRLLMSDQTFNFDKYLDFVFKGVKYIFNYKLFMNVSDDLLIQLRESIRAEVHEHPDLYNFVEDPAVKSAREKTIRIIEGIN